MKGESDNEDKDRPAEVQMGPSKPVFHLKLRSSLSRIVVFQGKEDNNATNDNKKYEEHEGSKTLETSIGGVRVSSHGNRPKSCSAEPRHEEYNQDLLEQKMATKEVKDSCHEAVNVLDRALAHLATSSAGSTLLAPGVMKLTLLLRQMLSRYIEGPSQTCSSCYPVAW